jgi:hypothetical protein
MPLGTIILVILVVLLIAALPTWPYSGAWDGARILLADLVSC